MAFIKDDATEEQIARLTEEYRVVSGGYDHKVYSRKNTERSRRAYLTDLLRKEDDLYQRIQWDYVKRGVHPSSKDLLMFSRDAVVGFSMYSEEYGNEPYGKLQRQPPTEMVDSFVETYNEFIEQNPSELEKKNIILFRIGKHKEIWLPEVTITHRDYQYIEFALYILLKNGLLKDNEGNIITDLPIRSTVVETLPLLNKRKEQVEAHLELLDFARTLSKEEIIQVMPISHRTFTRGRRLSVEKLLTKARSNLINSIRTKGETFYNVVNLLESNKKESITSRIIVELPPVMEYVDKLIALFGFKKLAEILYSFDYDIFSEIEVSSPSIHNYLAIIKPLERKIVGISYEKDMELEINSLRLENIQKLFFYLDNDIVSFSEEEEEDNKYFDMVISSLETYFKRDSKEEPTQQQDLLESCIKQLSVLYEEDYPIKVLAEKSYKDLKKMKANLHEVPSEKREKTLDALRNYFKAMSGELDVEIFLEKIQFLGLENETEISPNVFLNTHSPRIYYGVYANLKKELEEEGYVNWFEIVPTDYPIYVTDPLEDPNLPRIIVLIEDKAYLPLDLEMTFGKVLHHNVFTKYIFTEVSFNEESNTAMLSMRGEYTEEYCRTPLALVFSLISPRDIEAPKLEITWKQFKEANNKSDAELLKGGAKDFESKTDLLASYLYQTQEGKEDTENAENESSDIDLKLVKKLQQIKYVGKRTAEKILTKYSTEESLKTINKESFADVFPSRSKWEDFVTVFEIDEIKRKKKKKSSKKKKTKQNVLSKTKRGFSGESSKGKVKVILLLNKYHIIHQRKRAKTPKQEVFESKREATEFLKQKYNLEFP